MYANFLELRVGEVRRTPFHALGCIKKPSVFRRPGGSRSRPGCTQQPAVVGIQIAAPANWSAKELSSRNGRSPTHALVQPQRRELRVEGGAKERRGGPLAP